MQRALRNAGRVGIAGVALSAADCALWDLMARRHNVSLSRLLGSARSSVPIYGSGGFTTYDAERQHQQLAEWTGAGIQRVKIKIGESWGTSEPGTSEPGTSEPGTSEPGTSEPGTSEPGTSEPGTSEPTNAAGLASSLPELFDNDDPTRVCLNCMAPLPDDPDMPTPICDSTVAELGDPHEHREAFDKALAELDTFIRQVLHGQGPTR